MRLVVGFWVGSEGSEAVQSDFTVCGFQTTAAIRHNPIGLIICKSQKEKRLLDTAQRSQHAKKDISNRDTKQRRSECTESSKAILQLEVEATFLPT